MVCVFSRPGGLSRTVVTVVLLAGAAWSQQDSADWQQQVRNDVRLHHLDAALTLVQQRLEQAPSDLEAHGWLARLLAWQGQWASAESEYRLVLAYAPRDTEILCGLADVLLWQGKTKEALAVIDRARELDPTQPEILLRRARILTLLADSAEARTQYRELLRLDPANQEAKNGLVGLATEDKHEFRLTADASTFNYTGPAEDQVLQLTSHWDPRFVTNFATGFYQRFGQHAADVVASISYRATKSDSVSVGTAVASNQAIIPKDETFFEYGHGFRFSDRWVKGLEVSYLQHWFWYQGAHVLTLSSTQLYYLPREWTWSITVTGARSGFTGTTIEWVPSGMTRLTFPIHHNISASLLFANGTENFAQVDQIGHFSARTFAGGLRYRFAPGQDINGYIAIQRRSDGDTQNSFGVSYGFHF